MSLAIELIGSFFVLLGIWFMTKHLYRKGFWCNIASSICWGFIGFGDELWGLFGLNIIIFILGIRGLYTHRPEPSVTLLCPHGEEDWDQCPVCNH